MRTLHFLLALLALALTATIATSALVPALLFLTLVACLLNRPQGRLCTVTLSVPEILKDILAAFKLETPELFGPAGFAQDFSSKTAVLGDKITAKISHVPVVGSYDPSPGVGFYSGAQDVVNLIEDVPVTLNQLNSPLKNRSFSRNAATTLFCGRLGTLAVSATTKPNPGSARFW